MTPRAPNQLPIHLPPLLASCTATSAAFAAFGCLTDPRSNSKDSSTQLSGFPIASFFWNRPQNPCGGREKFIASSASTATSYWRIRIPSGSNRRCCSRLWVLELFFANQAACRVANCEDLDSMLPRIHSDLRQLCRQSLRRGSAARALTDRSSTRRSALNSSTHRIRP